MTKVGMTQSLQGPIAGHAEQTRFSLHAQRILSHRLPPALVSSCYVLVQRKTLREPEGTVLALAPGHHDTQDEDDQKKDGSCHQQWQQWHALLWGLQRLSCRKEAAHEPSAT